MDILFNWHINSLPSLLSLQVTGFVASSPVWR
ncbi:hypothetical protein T12_12064 [Trichinella patagoniensis]|uniref:Uncharacterized protein n=1 Tax=Trichinella patagoniensis TaxID=990121 RepID=A0A0V0YZI2_9BILA|nr:hypothetical protein T12_12064 [Trichinella patagoniensis]